MLCLPVRQLEIKLWPLGFGFSLVSEKSAIYDLGGGGVPRDNNHFMIIVSGLLD